MITENDDLLGDKSAPAWSARCDCYNRHESNSGRCTCRYEGPKKANGAQSVTDPTRFRGQPAYCAACRLNCGHGDGLRDANYIAALEKQRDGFASARKEIDRTLYGN